MFDVDNPLNSMSYEIENIIKNNISLTNANITVQRQFLNISSISDGNTFYILLLFPRTSKLAFASEGYGSTKRRKFRINVFVVAQTDSQCQQLVGKIQTFVDKNELVFTKFGLIKPQIRDEFMKLTDSKIYNSGTISGNLSCFFSSLEGEIWV